MTDSSNRFWISLALVGVAAVWGSTFIMVKDAVAAYPLYSFLGVRFAIAVVVFLAIFPRSIKGMLSPRTLLVGLLAGVLLTGGYVFQTWGLQDTSASKAAFITGMFVVITPILQAVLLRRPPKLITILGVGLAVTGLWLLSGSSGGGWNIGDTRVLLCAFAYASHMIVLGSMGRDHDPMELTLVQLLTVAVACAGIAVASEPLSAPTGVSLWVALLVTGVLASAVAFWVQTVAQRYISPTQTALILILEPAFGGLFGWLAGEALGARGLAGAALILSGMVAAELLGAAPAERGEQVVYEPSIEAMPVPMVEQVDDAAKADG